MTHTVLSSKRNRQILADIVRAMTEACFVLDREWRFTFVNDRCESLFHHRPEEMLGHAIWDVFHKLVGTPMEQNYRRAMSERVPVSFEATWQFKNPDWTLTWAQPGIPKGDRPWGAVYHGEKDSLVVYGGDAVITFNPRTGAHRDRV